MPIEWIARPNELPGAAIDRFARELQMPYVIAQLLMQREITSFSEAKRYFCPDLENLHNPFLMRGMEPAVERLSHAVQQGERILLYGDYDADGTLSVALAGNFLRGIGVATEFYIPDRRYEGYGLSKLGIEFAHARGVHLMLVSDCGTKDIETVEMAKELGIDVIICDHHLPGRILPKPIALINPKQPQCKYPFKDLCGCGVTFKLLHALCKALQIPYRQLYQYLDLVAVATMADVVPLKDENRVLTKLGIQQLNTNPSIGMKALKLATVSSDPEAPADSQSIVFRMVPPLNAAGRLVKAEESVKLMIARNENEANFQAKRLVEINNLRRKTDSAVTAQALSLIAEDPQFASRKSTVVMQPGWEKGIVGIVASRLIEQFYRPTIVLSEMDGVISGSGRSVEGFDIYKAIDACRDLLTKYGGHKGAVGLTLKPGAYPQFASRFEDYVAKHIQPQDLIRRTTYDAPLPLGEINSRFVRLLRHMEPFGQGNPEPIFMATQLNTCAQTRVIGTTQEHLATMLWMPLLEMPADTVAFFHPEWKPIFDRGNFSICYTVGVNYFRGNEKLQLQIKDIQ